MTIRFYRARDAHGELSNHSLHGFELDGLYSRQYQNSGRIHSG